MLHRRSFLKHVGYAAVCSCCSLNGARAADAVPLVCTELALPDYKLALEIAIDENLANDPAKENVTASEAISLYKKKWNPDRRILNVSFLTEPKYLQKVITQAQGWESYIGLKFRFGNSSPDVLVAFDEGGSWSFVGTDSRYYAQRGRPSMNFGWFDDATEEEEFRRTTLHEFGHALSLVHEHSHPSGDISWKKQAVYDYYAKQGWTPPDVDQQVFAKYQLSQVNGSAYDPTSIMHYPIAKELVSNQADVVGWNTKLSKLDQEVISKLYPSNDRGLPSREVAL
ncbi:M12 family metallopeptidase [Rhizobium laguerreae]|uniref:M12 family metallopeptidase n=1 Tax=Rhizobium laguerreae TaxID=1076926 RepID=UPI0013F1567B|nr:M12 family metallopeptidase [Rhizobium laguerreae]